jgi:aquaporin Z
VTTGRPGTPDQPLTGSDDSSGKQRPGTARSGPADAGRPGPGQPPRPGFHPVEWACEFLGTAVLLLLGLSAVCLDFGSHTPFSAIPTSPRLLLTGLVFGGVGSLIALTPFGRRSGAHLNPVVTIAFFTQRRVHWHDLVGYLVAQLLGAIVGTAAVRLLWQGQAVSVTDGATLPGAGISHVGAVALEAGMSACLLLVILFMTSNRRTTRFTPLVLWLLVATFVWRFSPFTGTSMNPARSLAPALIATDFHAWWVYLVGPLLGCAVAVGVFALARGTEVLTAKLFHDPSYESTMGSALPTRPHRPR